nr:probable inactive purple acid phosphatase 27 [Tanacetum cinerariifolium]
QVKGDVEITEQPLLKIDIHSVVIDLDDGASIQAYPSVFGIYGEDVEWVAVELKHPKSSNDDWIEVFSPTQFNASTCFVENDPKKRSPYICSTHIKYTSTNYSNAGYA